MATDRVECDRCGMTFASEDDLMAHSIETHATEGAVIDSSNGDEEASVATSGDIDAETAEQLFRLLESRAVSRDTLLIQYGQRFLLLAGLVVLLMAFLLSYLHITDTIGIAVYMFSLGILFGVALSYLQGFIQSARR